MASIMQDKTMVENLKIDSKNGKSSLDDGDILEAII
jgi:hypothetical protein